jgi:hypothetical protein
MILITLLRIEAAPEALCHQIAALESLTLPASTDDLPQVYGVFPTLLPLHVTITETRSSP